jgi:Putative DNA-binding domain
MHVGDQNPTTSQLIAAGEGSRIEFKSSLRVETETGQVNRELTKAVVKSIAGLSNADGGTLLIGVDNEGAVVGIEADIASLSRSSLDGFELTLRTALATQIGMQVGPGLSVKFEKTDDKYVARVDCPRHPSPVFFQEGDRQEFYVRDGNLTRPFPIRSAHEYIAGHWPPDAPPHQEIADAVLEGLRTRLLGIVPAPVEESYEAMEKRPAWMRVASRRVINLFLKTLSGSHGWKRLFIISPWISELSQPAVLTFDQVLARLVSDTTTAYVVTRPPTEPWHHQALERLGDTGRANVALVPDLHVKLFTARTDTGTFAMLGSANFTQQSLSNREIGVLVTGYSDGKRVVRQLDEEAAQIYRTPGRRLIYRASF